MKSVLSVATSALCLFASSAVASDAVRALAMKELNHIKDLANTLTGNILRWNGTLDDALFSIHQPAEETISYLQNATAELQKTPTTFNINQAFRVGGTTQDLAYAVNASVAALNTQVVPFKNQSIAPIVVTDVQDLLNATKIFSDVLLSYVSEQLRPIALGLQAQAIDSLQQGLDCYSDDKNTTEACNPAVVDPNRTHQMALRFGAIRRDGTPIA